jgi:hypothetical protein
MVHVHYRIDPDVHGISGFLDLLGGALVGSGGRLHYFKPSVAHYLETVCLTELAWDHTQDKSLFE